MSEEAGDREQALVLLQGAGEPPVVILRFLAGPVDVYALCAVPSQLTFQLLCFHPIQIPPQVQLGSYTRKDKT